MSASREFDVIVYGASGFTGQFVALHLAEIVLQQRAKKPTTWAIAGRSESKLTAIQTLVMDKTGVKAPILIADVNDSAAMKTMCAKGTVLLNCTGPYRFYGEQVVVACIENGTHYLDITGEPEFMERMIVKHHALAVQQNVLVISACGFDSIPSDIGTVFTTEQFPSTGCATSIEAFIEIKNAKHAHYTTYECIVLGVSNAKELKQLRQSKPKVIIPYVGPKETARHFGFDKRIGKYFVRFPGADAGVVRNSQEYLVTTGLNKQVTPVRYAVYMKLQSVFHLLAMFCFAVVLQLFCSFQFGKQLLLKYPKIFTLGAFTHEGPSAEDMERASFNFTFFAKGIRNKANSSTPDMEIVTRVSGPEAGYVATPIMLVTAALCVLDKEVKATGGVLTTAAAFRGTSLISKLTARGVKFEVL